MRRFILATALIATTPLAAQPVRHLTITVTDDGFFPHRVNLEHGQPYAIRVVNGSGRKHNMEAAEFFAASHAKGAGVRFNDGRVDIEPHRAITLRLTVPEYPGRYPFKSTLLTDAASGLSGEFLIR